MNELVRQVELLILKSAGVKDSLSALQYSQAALNVANAITHIGQSKEIPSRVKLRSVGGKADEESALDLLAELAPWMAAGTDEEAPELRELFTRCLALVERRSL